VKRQETIGYRSIVVASQASAWLVGQLLKLYFSIELHRPPGLFERGSESCLILAPMHTSTLDPWLIMSALPFRQWRALMPVRTLATQTFRGPLRWFSPLIRLLYRAEGAVELPPKEEGGTLPEKVQGLLKALRRGDVVAIFPEGGIWKKEWPPIGQFAPGVVYLQRRSGAGIVPIALWTSDQYRPRTRFVIEVGSPVHIPDDLDLDSAAAWLREQTLELYERARRRGETKR
jgi:1-acyl-sn-glycerol-3-phosphate acyltransferase